MILLKNTAISYKCVYKKTTIINILNNEDFMFFFDQSFFYTNNLNTSLFSFIYYNYYYILILLYIIVYIYMIIELKFKFKYCILLLLFIIIRFLLTFNFMWLYIYILNIFINLLLLLLLKVRLKPIFYKKKINTTDLIIGYLFFINFLFSYNIVINFIKILNLKNKIKYKDILFFIKIFIKNIIIMQLLNISFLNLNLILNFYKYLYLNSLEKKKKTYFFLLKNYLVTFCTYTADYNDNIIFFFNKKIKFEEYDEKKHINFYNKLYIIVLIIYILIFLTLKYNF